MNYDDDSVRTLRMMKSVKISSENGAFGPLVTANQEGSPGKEIANGLCLPIMQGITE